jgi:hypothetical protein
MLKHLKNPEVNHPQFINTMLRTKALFVHIPKTAGISVRKGLFNSGGSYHYSFQNYESIYKPSFIKKAFKFTFVRHPLSRVYSSYNYLKKGGSNIVDRLFYETHMSNFKNFEDFINNGLIKQEVIQRFIHFRTQKSFLVNCRHEISMDYIGKLETLETDYNHIKNKLKVAGELPNLNSNKENNTTVKDLQITDQTLMNIFCLYEDDYLIFNYAWNNTK